MSYTIHLDYFDTMRGQQSAVFYEDTQAEAVERATKWLDGYIGNGEIRQDGRAVLLIDNAGTHPVPAAFRPGVRARFR
jgi:hypothetical protein